MTIPYQQAHFSTFIQQAFNDAALTNMSKRNIATSAMNYKLEYMAQVTQHRQSRMINPLFSKKVKTNILNNFSLAFRHALSNRQKQWLA